MSAHSGARLRILFTTNPHYISDVTLALCCAVVSAGACIISVQVHVLFSAGKVQASLVGASHISQITDVEFYFY